MSIAKHVGGKLESSWLRLSTRSYSLVVRKKGGKQEIRRGRLIERPQTSGMQRARMYLDVSWVRVMKRS